MLVGPGRTAVPGVVGDVHEKVGPRRAIAARQIFERRLVADDHSEASQGTGVERQGGPRREPAGPVSQTGDAAKQAHRDEWNPLDHGHEIVLAVHGIRPPLAGRIVEKGGVVVGVPSHRIQTSREDRRVPLARQCGDLCVPRRRLRQPARHGGLGPHEEVEPAAGLELARQAKQLRHDGVGVRRIPFFVEALVRLHQADRTQLAQRQRAHAPGAIPPCREDRGQHRRDRTPPEGTAPRSPLPGWQERAHQHHIAPRQPQRHAAGACEVRPLHQHGRVAERRAQPEPGKPDVSLMSHRPFDGGPGEGEHQRERHGREAPAHPQHEPEQQAVPQPEDGDGGEVAEGRQRREVPQRDHQPIQDRALRHKPVGESPAQRVARVALLLQPAQQHDRRRDGDEAQQRKWKGRVAGDEQRGADRDQRGGVHSSTSRPSSAER